MNHQGLRARAAGLIGGLMLAGAAQAQVPGQAPGQGPGQGQPQPQPAIAAASVQIGGAIATPDVTYSTLQGYRPLKLDLYRPANPTGGPLPMVVYMHGGGWFGGSPRAGFVGGGDGSQALADLAARGYIVAGITYRFSSEAKAPAQIQDVRAAVRWLRRNAATYGGDPARVYAVGASAGGYLAALAGVSCGDASLDPRPAPGPGGATPPPPAAGSECVNGVVALYPVVDASTLSKFPSQNGPPSDSIDSPLGRFLGCAIAACSPQVMHGASILERIDAKDPPILIFHGDADTTVPLSQSQMLDAAMKKAGVSSELVVVPGASHGFPGVSPQAKTDILNRAWGFLDRLSGRRP